MKSKMALGLASTVALVGLLFLVQEHQRQANLRQENNALRQEVEAVAAENQRLSAQLTLAASDQAAAKAQARELMRLRSEVGGLKKQVADAAKNKADPPPQAKEQPQDGQEQERQIAIRKLTDAKLWTLALHSYVVEHDQQYPSNFDEVGQYLDAALKSDDPGEARRDKAIFTATTNQFEMVFHGSLKDLTNWGNVIVLREKEPRPYPDGAWTRTYAYADGHSENHLALDGNFEDWEAEHSVNTGEK
jgi:hypothetical protein